MANEKKELRVYLYDKDNMMRTRNPLTCSNEKFIKTCEKQGGVYSLAIYQAMYNCKMIDSSNTYIRFIEV